MLLKPLLLTVLLAAAVVLVGTGASARRLDSSAAASGVTPPLGHVDNPPVTAAAAAGPNPGPPSLQTLEAAQVHQPFRLTLNTAAALLLSLVVSALSAAAGVGGGAVFVPLFCLLLGFTIKLSTSLSQAVITGASLGGFSGGAECPAHTAPAAQLASLVVLFPHGPPPPPSRLSGVQPVTPPPTQPRTFFNRLHHVPRPHTHAYSGRLSRGACQHCDACLVRAYALSLSWGVGGMSPLCGGGAPPACPDGLHAGCSPPPAAPMTVTNHPARSLAG